MKLTDIFKSYNDVSTQHRVMYLFGKKIVDVSRFFKIRDKYLLYEIPNHIEGKYIYKGDYETDNLISNVILAGKPAMIARIGRSEFNIVQYFYDRKDSTLQIKYPQSLIDEAITCPGIFSADTPSLIRFSSEVLDFLRDIDILLVWSCFASPEYYRTKACMLKEYANPLIKLGTVHAINSGMFKDYTWTKLLKGKKVLVIHPFTDTIKKQYERRESLFDNKEILPDFDLKLIKAPQGIGENNLKEEYVSWHNALKCLQKQMDETDFDICLIGAGAYGFHLAHYAKSIGKIGIHVAGALQTLFGIKGGRWLNSPLINENWVFPAQHEYPKNNEKFIKGEGCNAYW